MNYLKSAKFKGKSVFVRVDVNEPLVKNKNGHYSLLSDFRVESVVPTIKFLQKNRCRIILGGHLGRPEGKHDSELSMRPVAERLSHLLNLKLVETDHRLPNNKGIGHLIFYTGNLEDPVLHQKFSDVQPHDIILLDNLRFYKGEEKSSPVFAKRLASLAQVFVNDGFGVSHRKSASVTEIPKLLPAYAGLELQSEMQNLSKMMTKPKSPFALMMGGIKISDKSETLMRLGKHADHILLGGGLANVMLEVAGYEIGKSVIEKSGLKNAKDVWRNYKNKLVMPIDVVVANPKFDKASIRVSDSHKVKKSEMILDLGPQTILKYANILKLSQTIVWNGPLGFFEHKPFHTSTMALARVIGGRAKGKAYAVAGGGETITALQLSHQIKYIDHVSTGGGAMLEFLAGKKLPGIEALKK